MEKYRTPTIEEFVQGFEFEVAQDISYGFLDMTDNKSSEISSSRSWIPTTVTWKEDEMSEIWDKPFDEQSYLDQGLIRVKIKD